MQNQKLLVQSGVNPEKNLPKIRTGIFPAEMAL